MLISHRYYLVTKREYTQNDGKISFSLNHIEDIPATLDTLKDTKWKKFKVDNSSLLRIPQKSGIYAISITDKVTKQSDIAYIGSSININRRFISHQALHFLKYGLHDKYKIEIYVCFVEKRYKGAESEAIRLFKPFLNKVKEQRTYIEYKFDKRRR